MNSFGALLSFLVTFSAVAADLSKQYIEAKAAGEKARLAREIEAENRMRREAGAKSLKRIAKRLALVLQKHHVEFSTAQLLSEEASENLSAQQFVTFIDPKLPGATTPFGIAEIVVHYRSDGQLCRIQGERRIFTTSLIDRIRGFLPHFTWVTGPNCVAAPQ